MLSPTQLLESLPERCDLGLHFWIIFSQGIQHGDSPHAPARLRPRRERPRRCPAEQRYELAAPHSITSSARASTEDGISSPSAFAVLRLMISSYLVDAWTGRSAGFSPLRMRST